MSEFYKLKGSIGFDGLFKPAGNDAELIEAVGGFSGPPTLTLRVSGRQYLDGDFPQKNPETAAKLAAMSESDLGKAIVDIKFDLEPDA